jgi:hypothetical protein
MDKLKLYCYADETSELRGTIERNLEYNKSIPKTPPSVVVNNLPFGIIIASFLVKIYVPL